MRLHATMLIQVSSLLQQQTRQGKMFKRVMSVPMSLFDDDAERRCRQYHDQTLDQIASKGGFDAVEACAVLGVLDPFTRGTAMSEQTAHRVLSVCTQLYQRSPE